MACFLSLLRHWLSFFLSLLLPLVLLIILGDEHGDSRWFFDTKRHTFNDTEHISRFDGRLQILDTDVARDHELDGVAIERDQRSPPRKRGACSDQGPLNQGQYSVAWHHVAVRVGCVGQNKQIGSKNTCKRRQLSFVLQKGYRFHNTRNQLLPRGSSRQGHNVLRTIEDAWLCEAIRCEPIYVRDTSNSRPRNCYWWIIHSTPAVED